jgi:hypothetical protein
MASRSPTMKGLGLDPIRRIEEPVPNIEHTARDTAQVRLERVLKCRLLASDELHCLLKMPESVVKSLANFLEDAEVAYTERSLGVVSQAWITLRMTWASLRGLVEKLGHDVALVVAVFKERGR